MEEQLLEELYADVETVKVTPEVPPTPASAKTPEKKEPEEKTQVPDRVIETPPIVPTDDLDDLFSEEEEEGDKPTTDVGDNEGDEQKKEVTKSQKPKKPKETEVLTREEAVRGVAKHFASLFDIPEDAEIDYDSLTEENVVEFISELGETYKQTVYNELKNSDNFTSQLLSFKEQGGDPTDIIKLYKEEQAVNTLDISKERNQKAVVSNYLTNELDWAPEEVEDYIENLVNTEKLEKEATKFKQKYEKVYEQKRSVLIQKQQAQKRREEQILVQRQSEFDKVVKSKKLHSKEAQELAKLAFGKGKFSNGKEIDLIDYEVAKLQRNPEAYLELVRFVKDPEAYKKSVLKEAANSVADEGFKKAFKFSTTRKKENIVEEKAPTKGFKFEF